MHHSDKKFSVIWRGKKFILDMNLATNLKELGDALQRLTNVKPGTMRLIVPMNKGSKLFYPLSDDHSHLALEAANIVEGKSVRMMGVPENEVDELLQNSKADHRIAGFDEEEKRLRRRISDGKISLPKLPQGTYIFSEFRTLDIPGLELNPPPSEALKLMHTLAADPGIVAIMTKHRWRVGIMTEMAPVGYVGVSPKCILGFNKNHGEEISLRLRTDDLNGFRKYESIKKTLLHELAHMVYSEHDANFYALDKQLNEEAATLDWTKAKGYSLARHSLHSAGESSKHISSSQKLGGHASAFSNARASSVAAAYHRFANASNNALRTPDMHEEPVSDHSGFTTCQEPDCLHIEGKTETSMTYAGTVQKYSDVHDALHSEFEPDPDDSEGGEAMESEHCMHSGGNGTITEPHADHSEVTVVPILVTKASEELAPKNVCVSMKDGIVAGSESLRATESLENLNELKVISSEPDPDDSGLMKNDVDYKDALGPDCDKGLFMKDETQPALLAKSSCMEPDPDDSQPSTVARSEPEPDDDIIVFGKTMSKGHADEPDPDEMELQRIQDPVSAICGRLLKAIEMLRSELNPLAVTSILQTILRILRNVIEHPAELKFRKLRKANPIIQRDIVSHRAAVEVLHLIGFSEDVLIDGMGNAETYLILKRNDPGMLWLAKTSLESSIA